MPQLPIIPAVSPQPGTGVSQASASFTTAAEGGDELGGAAALDFGAILTQQLKGGALLLEQKEGAMLPAAANESGELAANAGAAILPVDLSAFVASMLVQAQATPVQTGAGVEISTEAEAESLSYLGESGSPATIPTEEDAGSPLLPLPETGGARTAAEIAAYGKKLPQVESAEQRLADKLVALGEVTGGNVGREIHSTDLPAIVNSSATSVALRNPDILPALPVAPRVGSAEWGGAVGEKVVWMASQSRQVAELHLNPPNLGPLEVRLTISGDQASAMFVSHHSAVREAIETALPRLREMLADNGIMLGNTTVGSESFSQQQAYDQKKGNSEGRGGMGEESAMTRVAVLGRPAGVVREGMVDIFA